MTHEAIVLAGGFGTRLRDVVSDVPKPLAPVAGRPFLEYVLERLASQDYSHIVLATGYMHDKVADCLGQSFGGMSVDYAQETTPLGTGGAILNALQLCSGDNVTVLNGDTLFLADLHRLQTIAAERHTPLAIALRHVPDAARYGAVDIDETGRITRFCEKSTTDAGTDGLINGGIYQLQRSLLAGHTVGETFSFEKDVMQRLYTDIDFYGMPSDAYFIDIGIPQDYTRAQTELPRL